MRAGDGPVPAQRVLRGAGSVGTRPKIVVTADGRGVVGDVGALLLTDLADTAGLAEAVCEASKPLRQRAFWA